MEGLWYRSDKKLKIGISSMIADILSLLAGSAGGVSKTVTQISKG